MWTIVVDQKTLKYTHTDAPSCFCSCGLHGYQKMHWTKRDSFCNKRYWETWRATSVWNLKLCWRKPWGWRGKNFLERTPVMRKVWSTDLCEIKESGQHSKQLPEWRGHLQKGASVTSCISSRGLMSTVYKELRNLVTNINHPINKETDRLKRQFSNKKHNFPNKQKYENRYPLSLAIREMQKKHWNYISLQSERLPSVNQ